MTLRLLIVFIRVAHVCILSANALILFNCVSRYFLVHIDNAFEPQILNDLLLILLQLDQVKVMVVDKIATSVTMLLSIMLPIIDKQLCLRVVLFQDFL